jgi:hypothetical protein
MYQTDPPRSAKEFLPTMYWYDALGNWVLTPEERERKQGERERRRAERLAAQLRALGVEPDFGDDEEG